MEHTTPHTSGQRGGSTYGKKEGTEEDEGNKGDYNAANAEEKNATWSFVSFSLENEVEEPWPLLLLSYVCKRCEDESRSGGGIEEDGGEQGGAKGTAASAMRSK